MAMVIPMTQGVKLSASAPQAQPSQTDLLMALALMHKDGRFKPQVGEKEPQSV